MNRKIIHITLGKANPNRPNGVNKVVDNILHYQVENGLDAELWGISFNLEHNYPNRNYNTHIFKDSKLKFKLDPALKLAIRQLDPERTIIHLHGVFLPQLFAVARLIRAQNIPYFFTPHGGYNLKALEKSKWLKRIYIGLFERFLVRHAKGVQLLGKSEGIGFSRYFSNKTHLIPNGQPLLHLLPENTEKEKVTIGFLGRIDIHTKGLDILLDGFQKVAEKFSLHLEIVGDNGEIDQLKKMVTGLQLNDFVTFKGALFGEKKFETIRRWDALCLVSRNEGLPGVVLEAASVGVPSIVSPETNLGDYIDQFQSGWILEQYNGYGVANCLVDLAQAKASRQLPEFQKNAKQMVAKAFDWNRIVQQLNHAYAC